MQRRSIVTALLPQPEPDPAYDLFHEIRAHAERKSGGPLDPADVQRMDEVSGRRGPDWCTAVMGRYFHGVPRISTTEGWMLIIADELQLDPPLPPSIVEERRIAEEARKQREARAKERRQREQERWETAKAKAPVDLTPMENTRHTGVGGSLRHAVPAVELISGRSRKHKADRGLCETPDRANPLRLGPADGPVNCHRCLDYTPKVRTLDAPAPPTEAEARMLKLVHDGVVYTLHPGRAAARTIRDTSEPSPSAAWGALGRKVDAQVKKLEKKGWVREDTEYSRTQGGQYGELWRLTKAGTAALEA
ncbi:hypothetical protein [Streptomyces sp. NPDC001635]